MFMKLVVCCWQMTIYATVSDEWETNALIGCRRAAQRDVMLQVGALCSVFRLFHVPGETASCEMRGLFVPIFRSESTMKVL